MLSITSGEYVESELFAEFGRIPPAFLPVGNKRLYTHQISQLAPHYGNGAWPAGADRRQALCVFGTAPLRPGLLESAGSDRSVDRFRQSARHLHPSGH